MSGYPQISAPQHGAPAVRPRCPMAQAPGTYSPRQSLILSNCVQLGPIEGPSGAGRGSEAAGVLGASRLGESPCSPARQARVWPVSTTRWGHGQPGAGAAPSSSGEGGAGRTHSVLGLQLRQPLLPQRLQLLVRHGAPVREARSRRTLAPAHFF